MQALMGRVTPRTSGTDTSTPELPVPLTLPPKDAVEHDTGNQP